MRVKAWVSEEAREAAGRYSDPYQDRPIAKPHWKKLSDTPVQGLSVFKVPDQSPSSGTPDDSNKPAAGKSKRKDEESPPSRGSNQRDVDQRKMDF